MRAVIQRVEHAEVRVNDRITGAIGPGLLVLLGIAIDDTAEDRDWILKRVLTQRIFDDAGGVMTMDVATAGASLLVVSQFTLLASTRKGTKPSWHRAAPPDRAREIYDDFVQALRQVATVPVSTGEFGALMRIALVNSGPVTLIIDSRSRE